MTPADVIEKALRKHMRLRTGDMMSGAEIQDAALIALDALAGAGMVVVPAEDLERLREEAAYSVEALNGAENRRQMWRERAEKVEASNAQTRARLDALIAAGFGAVGDTLRELRATLDGQEGDRG